LVEFRGSPPYRYVRAGVADLVLDAQGMNTVSFPRQPGAVFFADADQAREAAQLVNEAV
jgi:hypothetical protein